MGHVRIRKMKNPSSFRKIAAAAWPHPSDSTIFGHLEIRAEKLEDWLRRTCERTGSKVTVTHAVARAVALALRQHPTLNGMIRHSSVYLRETVDVFLQVAIAPDDGDLGKTDLSGALIRQADTKPVEDLARTLRERAAAIRADQDAEFRRTKRTLGLLPGFLLRPLLLFLDFLQYSLNISLTWAGLGKDPFGSAMVTSLGMHGVKMGFAPIFPIAHCPLLVLVGALEDKAVVEGGSLAVGRVLNLTASMDHRMIDGFQAARLAVTMRELLEAPESLDLAPVAGG